MHAHPIVVGVDGSTAARHAARWAAREALCRGLTVRLVSVYEIPLGYPPGIIDPDALRRGFQERGWLWLRDARDAVAEIAPELTTELVLERAAVVPALLDQSPTASLLVLGTRGLGGFSGLLIGSTAVAVAGRAHCPVVVARGPGGAPPPMDGPVVVGVDGTPAGEAAIAFAFDEAATHDRALIAMHAWTDTLFETAMFGDVDAPDFRPLQQQAHEILAERLAGWQEKYPEVKICREVVQGRPARTLLRYADTASMIVLGTRGRGGFRGLILGSTSQQLLHHAACPVAVVRTEPEEEEES